MSRPKPPFPAPETLGTASPEDLDSTRKVLMEALLQSKGKTFTFKVELFKPGTAQILLAELLDSGWASRRESDQREGDFYFIYPQSQGQP